MIDDPRIDTAIESYDVAALPKGFTKRTMLRVADVGTEQPAFRLHFIDMAIPVFVMSFLATIMLVGGYMLNSANPFWLQDLQAAGATLFAEVGGYFPIVALGLGLIGMTVFLLALLLITLISSRPQVRLQI
ncbi:MAG: hypothetical protein DWQ07_00060 [Chloroflexi bacterium]|nr:MAG: hypothetical protein DWQ07_00060 [Chloroflexota bacterium]MBL1196045.1 hypothetical protein [Chloroflexota bacterium]NOH13339.1 hypothetical protein [Chloroflexota bacterium]